MIQIEYLNNGTLVRHCSDAGVLLLQIETGVKYAEAIDAIPCVYTYVETDEPVEQEPTEMEEVTLPIG